MRIFTNGSFVITLTYKYSITRYNMDCKFFFYINHRTWKPFIQSINFVISLAHKNTAFMPTAKFSSALSVDIVFSALAGGNLLGDIKFAASSQRSISKVGCRGRVWIVEGGIP